MSTRRAKQLIYGALYVLIVVVFCGLGYLVFVHPFASAPAVLCTPGTCAPTGTASLAAGTVKIFVTSPGHYTFLAQVTNKDPNYGASLLNYEIDLDDASGNVLQSIPAQSFIYPAQSKYLAVLNQAIATPFHHVSLVFTSAYWLPAAAIGATPSVAPGQFAIQNVQGIAGSSTVTVGGQLSNASLVTYGQVVILVLFNGPYGSPVGVSQTLLSNIGPGSSNNFSVIYPAVPGIDPAQNQVIVYALR